MNVKKLVILMGLGTVSILFLAGCASTSEPNISAYLPKQKPVKLEGKTYLVPRNADKYEKVQEKVVAKYFKNGGANCRVGDIAWFTKKGYKSMSDVIQNTPANIREQKFELKIMSMARNKEAGCVRPMTVKQKKSYMRELTNKQILLNARMNSLSAQKQRRLSRQYNNDLAYYRENNSNTYSNNQERKYVSYTGQKYKYDLSNPGDRVMYSVDPAAQIRDSINPMVDIDRNLGQYGGGSYGY